MEINFVQLTLFSLVYFTKLVNRKLLLKKVQKYCFCFVVVVVVFVFFVFSFGVLQILKAEVQILAGNSVKRNNFHCVKSA